MDKFALLALLEAKPGKEKELEEFLKSAQPLAVREPGTTTWYAVKLYSRQTISPCLVEFAMRRPMPGAGGSSSHA